MISKVFLHLIGVMGIIMAKVYSPLSKAFAYSTNIYLKSDGIDVCFYSSLTGIKLFVWK
jgi:hypothetical protein